MSAQSSYICNHRFQSGSIHTVLLETVDSSDRGSIHSESTNLLSEWARAQACLSICSSHMHPLACCRSIDSAGVNGRISANNIVLHQTEQDL